MAHATWTGRSSGPAYIAATFPRMRPERWANAVASAGTRAIAPPRTRSWTTGVAAVEAAMWSRIAAPSTWSVNIVRPTASGR